MRGRGHLAFEKLRDGGFLFPCTCSRRVRASRGGRGGRLITFEMNMHEGVEGGRVAEE